MIIEILIYLGCLVIILLGSSQVSKVRFYAWNMPEAYKPAEVGSIIMMIGGAFLGFTLGIS